MRDFVCSRRRSRGLGAFALTLSFLLSPALAQQAAEPHDHSQHAAPPVDHSQHKMGSPDHSGHQPATGAAKKSAPKTPAKHSGHPASHGAPRHPSPAKQATHRQHGAGRARHHGCHIIG